MTYHPDSVLVEKVAKALWEARDSLPWALAPQVQYRRDAGAVLSVACPLVAGVIADRLEVKEQTTSGDCVQLRAGILEAVGFVRREFVDGEA